MKNNVQSKDSILEKISAMKNLIKLNSPDIIHDFTLMINQCKILLML